MVRYLSAGWWSWFATLVLLGAFLGLAAWPALAGAFLVNAVHALVFAAQGKSLAVQVRVVFAALLLAGLWPPLAVFHALQLAGAVVVVFFDYCLLARLLVLLPRNREVPFSPGLVRKVLLSSPRRGSVFALVRADGKAPSEPGKLVSEADPPDSRR
jgi:hypothetical protein